MDKKLLSVIVPAYNEEVMIEKTARTIGEILKEADISYEILSNWNIHIWIINYII